MNDTKDLIFFARKIFTIRTTVNNGFLFIFVNFGNQWAVFQPPKNIRNSQHCLSWCPCARACACECVPTESELQWLAAMLNTHMSAIIFYSMSLNLFQDVIANLPCQNNFHPFWMIYGFHMKHFSAFKTHKIWFHSKNRRFMIPVEQNLQMEYQNSLQESPNI